MKTLKSKQNTNLIFRHFLSVILHSSYNLILQFDSYPPFSEGKNQIVFYSVIWVSYI